MKEIYLPRLKKIVIHDYSLYLQQPTFEFEFAEGISAIIGVNGIGKTTFVEMIMYCLVGCKRIYNDNLRKNTKKKKVEFKNEDYFSERMKHVYKNNKDASVQLHFSIKENDIIVKRSLAANKILYLEVNGKKTMNLTEEYYENILIKYTKISSFRFIEKIIRNFLFFDERRNNIAWEAETQDEILRILLFNEDFFNKFTFLENEVIRWDSTGRHKSEDRRIVSKSYEELIKEKQSLIDEIEIENPYLKNKIDKIETNSNKLFDLQKRKNSLENEKEDIESELESKIIEYNMQDEKLNRLIGERDAILLKIEEINEKITSIESILYSAIYDKLPDFYVLLERTLCNEGECQVCGAKSKAIKDMALESSENSQCLVCSSKLDVNEEINYELIEELNNLNTKLKEQKVILSNKKEIIRIVSSKKLTFNNEIKVLNSALDSKKNEIMHVQSLISKYNTDNDTDMLTEILKAKQNQINELTDEINYAYSKRDEYKKELTSLHNKFKKIIKQLNKSFSQYFNKYASTFLGFKCELTVKERTLNKIPHVIYLPVINNDVRSDIWAVSESQRFFIDQAFRMAIIDYLQNNIIGFETFFITETPEGSLDIAYEAKVAEMFIKFSKSKNNIVFTSNLNSSKFLNEVFKQIPRKDRENRVLNLLEKGDVTAVQKNSLPTLLKLYEDVLRGDKNED